MGAIADRGAIKISVPIQGERAPRAAIGGSAEAVQQVEVVTAARRGKFIHRAAAATSAGIGGAVNVSRVVKNQAAGWSCTVAATLEVVKNLLSPAATGVGQLINGAVAGVASLGRCTVEIAGCIEHDAAVGQRAIGRALEGINRRLVPVVAGTCHLVHHTVAVAAGAVTALRGGAVHIAGVIEYDIAVTRTSAVGASGEVVDDVAAPCTERQEADWRDWRRQTIDIAPVIARQVVRAGSEQGSIRTDGDATQKRPVKQM